MSKGYLTAEDYQAAFHGIELPEGPIELLKGSTIPDVQIVITNFRNYLKTEFLYHLLISMPIIIVIILYNHT